MWSETDIRLMGLAAPVIVKMLRKREASILNRIQGEFRSDKTEFRASLAEWVCVRDQIHEIEMILNQHNKTEGAKHEPRDDDRPTF